MNDRSMQCAVPPCEWNLVVTRKASLQISASKLLKDWSGNIKMPNIFFEQNLQAEKVNITTESYIFQLV